MPRSKRVDASVLIPSALLVARICAGAKYAASNTTRFVAVVISEFAPPITPPMSSRIVGIGDHQHAGGQRPLLAVERGHGLARLRAAHLDHAAAHLGEIEGVHRLPELEHHVVGDVDDVADRADAVGEQPVLQPLRRGANGDVGCRGDISAAQLRLFDRDGNLAVRGELTVASRPGTRPAMAKPSTSTSGKLIRRGNLSRDPDHATSNPDDSP